jgi:ubiquinone/menaquinone biosynthesis C-methylase UbiE
MTPPADRVFWQTRYRHQVSWTAELRRYAQRASGLPPDARLLEVGCGYGALLEGLLADGHTRLTGLDLDLPALRSLPAQSSALCADGLRMPFPSACFDACLCHFYLLWSAHPVHALQEMKRVVRPGGWLFVLAEPDYSARVDEPTELAPLGELQTRALLRHGAHPFIGAHLAALFHTAGLVNVECGKLSLSPSSSPFSAEEEDEWQVLAADLRGLLSPAELSRWEALERQARRAGTRRLYVPVHYAFGQIPT